MTAATLKLEKVLTFCEQRNFFNVVKSGNLVYSVNYGALGSQLQSQIMKEWNHATFSDGKTAIFPVISPTFLFSQLRKSLLPGMLQQYLPTLKLVGNRLPFGLAQSGVCFLKGEATNKQDENFQPVIWRPEEFTSLTIVFFCPPRSSLEWLTFWSKRRLLWWKKFSGFLSDFSATEISEPEPGLHCTELLYQTPWGNLHLEKITNFGSKPLEELSKETDRNFMANDGRKIVLPHVIVCETSLDMATLTYLLDAYEEKERGTILRLHRKFAPYKAAVAVGTESVTSATKLRDLAQHTLEDLCEVGIPSFPNPDLHNSVSLEAQLIRFDELGLPYTIILDEGTLQTGVANLRNRDTMRKEQVHVTDLKALLLRYMQIVQPSAQTE